MTYVHLESPVGSCSVVDHSPSYQKQFAVYIFVQTANAAHSVALELLNLVQSGHVCHKVFVDRDLTSSVFLIRLV